MRAEGSLHVHVHPKRLSQISAIFWERESGHFLDRARRTVCERAPVVPRSLSMRTTRSTASVLPNRRSISIRSWDQPVPQADTFAPC
jgi:hypothetical protein